MKPRRSFGNDPITRAQAMTQFRILLASASDEKVLALTIDQVCAMHRVDRREAEAVLLARQDKIRRAAHG